MNLPLEFDNEKFDLKELERIRNKNISEKIGELLDSPEVYCKDMVYLISYHLTTLNEKDDMLRHLTVLKSFIEKEQDDYVLEQLCLYLNEVM